MEGLLFFGYYLAYTADVIRDATAHDAQGAFGAIMLWFVIPLAAMTLGVLALRVAHPRGRSGLNRGCTPAVPPLEW